MLRKTMLALTVLAVLGLAAAQIVISPTVTDAPDVYVKGAASASASQTVVMQLPQATALHLATGEILFDLTDLDEGGWADRARSGVLPADFPYACVYVSGADVPTGLGTYAENFWGQTQVVPGGIAYAANSTPASNTAPASTGWDDIRLVYFGNGLGDGTTLVPAAELVVTYPPIRIDPTTNKLVEGSKDYFVCYQTFVIQLFSNSKFFRLQVSRADAAGAQGIQHLYVQGNTCAEFGAGTGLYALPNGATRHLLPRSLTAGPTGSRNTVACNPNSSWMDVLGVLAVKVNSDLYGPSTANLTYTLVSSDTAFPTTLPTNSTGQ